MNGRADADGGSSVRWTRIVVPAMGCRRPVIVSGVGGGTQRIRGRSVLRSVGSSVWAFALCCLVLLGGITPVASAEDQPSIVKAYGLDWIERVREEAWPQPKDRRPIICLLDTGVAITPDTPEDNPLGPIVARLALDGGTGLPQGDAFEHRHGTDMASVIAAPRNGVGTVGVFPQARIVSVRVTAGAETYITPRAIGLGVHACTRWAVLQQEVRIAAVVMAESFYDQRELDVSSWETATAWAQAAGALFVAAVGNDQNAQAVAPVAAGDALAVGAGDAAGALCSFAQYQVGVGFLGPGCTDDPRWPAGSSAATAAIGALVAAFATRAPELGPQAIRSVLVAGATSGLNGSLRLTGDVLVDRQFSGLISDEAVQPSVATEVAPPGRPSPRPSTSILPEPALRLWRPDVKATWWRGRLTVSRVGRPRAGRLVVAVTTRTSRSVVEGRPGQSIVARRLSARPKRVEVWMRGGSQRPWRSMVRRTQVVSR